MLSSGETKIYCHIGTKPYFVVVFSLDNPPVGQYIQISARGIARRRLSPGPKA
jgi:hypothetical protein